MHTAVHPIFGSLVKADCWKVQNQCSKLYLFSSSWHLKILIVVASKCCELKRLDSCWQDLKVNRDATKTCYVLTSQKLNPEFKRHSARCMGERIADDALSPPLFGLPAEEELRIKWKTCCKGPM